MDDIGWTAGPGEGEAWLTALPFAAVVVARDGRLAARNDRAAGLLAGSADAGRQGLSDLFAEVDRGAAAEIHGQVLAGERWQGRLRVTRAGRGTVETELSWAPFGPAAEGTSLLVLEEASTSGRDANRLAERLTLLAKATAELVRATDLDDVTGIVIGHLADAMGATVATLSVVEEPGRLRLVGMRGGRPGAIDRWRTFSMAGTPAGDCVLTGTPLFLTGKDEIHASYPTLETAAEGDRTLVCIPLVLGGVPAAAVTLTFPGRRTFTGPELEFLSVMADTCAQTIDRLREGARAADRAAKLRFLADATAELTSSLDYESTLSNVARSAVPWFADWCSIAVAFDGELRTLAVAHVDPAKVAIARDYQERYPPDPAAPAGPYQVLRTGESQLVPEISDELLDASVTDEEQRAMVRLLNLRSAISVPLTVGDKVLGVATWVAGEEGRRFTTDDLAFGEDLARRAAVAIDNAQLHTEVREMAIRLQRAVLPEALPQLPGWERAAHYAPAGHLDAGGDFYDVIAISPDEFAVFIGDVMGRGVHAAAAMAEMRAAMRVLVAVDPHPASVLEKMDTFFETYGLEQLVTMLYLVVSTDSGRVLVGNAGHLPPVLVRADGGAEAIRIRQDRLLGAPTGERSVSTFTMLPGDALVAFTDGLVERRGEDIDTGQRRLLDACARIGAASLVDGLPALAEAMSDAQRDDDVAAICLRRR